MVESATHDVAGPDAPGRRLTVSGYVDHPIDAIIEVFTRPEVGELLARSLALALNVSFENVSVHRLAPVSIISASNAQVEVVWRAITPEGDRRYGTATIGLLVVQSGHAPVTELLVGLNVAGDDAQPAAAATRRFLDHISFRLRHAPLIEPERRHPPRPAAATTR